MIPSIKTIIERLGAAIEHEHGTESVNAKAKEIRELMEKAISHKEIDGALDTINDIIGGYGVEAITDNNWERYCCNIGLLHVNMGDTYVQTVIYDTRKDRFYVCSWGDIIERNEKRFS